MSNHEHGVHIIYSLRSTEEETLPCVTSRLHVGPRIEAAAEAEEQEAEAEAEEASGKEKGRLIDEQKAKRTEITCPVRVDGPFSEESIHSNSKG